LCKNARELSQHGKGGDGDGEEVSALRSKEGALLRQRIVFGANHIVSAPRQIPARNFQHLQFEHTALRLHFTKYYIPTPTSLLRTFQLEAVKRPSK
jgi:hypothetical protein